MHKNIGNKPNLEGFQSKSKSNQKALKEKDFDQFCNPNSFTNTYRLRADQEGGWKGALEQEPVLKKKQKSVRLN